MSRPRIRIGDAAPEDPALRRRVRIDDDERRRAMSRERVRRYRERHGRSKKLGLADWSPLPESRLIVQQVLQILTEYASFLPLTVRQIFYRLVGVHDYPKTEDDYRRLSRTLSHARRCGMVSWDAIRDDGITWFRPKLSTHDPRERVAALLMDEQHTTFDRQEGQEVRLLIGVEAAGMAPQISQIAKPFGVPVFASGGFDSVTFKYNLARELAQLAQHQAIELLQIGDHDNSGHLILGSLRDDVLALVRDLGADASAIAFTRIAVTEEQIKKLTLPTAPAKKNDMRGLRLTETVQAEAIAPNTLAEIVRTAIEQRQDQDLREAVLRAEDAATRAVNRELRRLGGYK